MDPLIGRNLDRYLITGILGEGGMGIVYRGYDPRLQRPLAVKVMHAQFARQPVFQERFLQEARTAARLDHPGIIKVYDSGEVDGTLYIVMEFIAGANLRHILSSLRGIGQSILLSEVTQLVRQVCLALDYAHLEGVLHRDIKPDNLMLKRDAVENLPYRPVITDLGLAKLVEGIPITRDGESLGTPGYMSPEQIQGLPVDARSDVYSLGILLYEIITGQLPFPAKSISEAMRYHVKEPPPPPQKLRPDLPSALEEIVLIALQKAPAERYPNAAALAQALARMTPAIISLEAPVLSAAEKETPVAGKTIVSLLPFYQKSVVEGGPGIPGQPEKDLKPQPPAGLARIQVMSPERTMRTIPVKPLGMRIGRGEDNDIVLDDAKVSRQHARIEFDGRNYKVIDLKSTNGTFLADVRLLPDVPEVWTPDKALLIGDTWLHLEGREIPREAGGPRIEGTRVDEDRIIPGSAFAKAGVYLDTSQFAVAPGNSIPIKLVVVNQSALVDRFKVSLAGIPEGWLSPPSVEVALMPGENQEARLTLQPPFSPESRAGTYPIEIQVTSVGDTKEITRVKANLNVAPFYQFSLDLRPKKQSGLVEGSFSIHLLNQSNSDLDIQLSASDPEEACQYTFTPPGPVIPPGQESVVAMKVQPKIARPGQSRIYPFTITARAAHEPRLSQQVSGEWEQIMPVLDLELVPEHQDGTVQGIFDLRLANQGSSEVTVLLQAADPQQLCTFTFEPSQVRLLPGQEEKLKLTAQLKIPARPGGNMVTVHPFTVTATLTAVPEASWEAHGEWHRLPIPMPAPPTRPKPRRALGCTVFFLGLFFNVFVSVGASILAYNLLGNNEEVSLLCAGVAFLIGVVLCFALARSVGRVPNVITPPESHPLSPVYPQEKTSDKPGSLPEKKESR